MVQVDSHAAAGLSLAATAAPTSRPNGAKATSMGAMACAPAASSPPLCLVTTSTWVILNSSDGVDSPSLGTPASRSLLRRPQVASSRGRSGEDRLHRVPSLADT